jgi:hypothetical protein
MAQQKIFADIAFLLRKNFFFVGLSTVSQKKIFLYLYRLLCEDLSAVRAAASLGELDWLDAACCCDRCLGNQTHI